MPADRSSEEAITLTCAQMLALCLTLAIAAAPVSVTIESDLPGATLRIDEISQDLALPATINLAEGAHELVLQHASLPPLKAKLTVGPIAPHHYVLSIEDPEHAPIVKLIRADKDDDVAIDGRFLTTPIQESNVVTPGAHELLLRRRGEQAEKRIRLVLERGQTAVFELSGAKANEPAPKQVAIAPIIPPVRRSSPLYTAGWVLIGAGAAGALAGAYLAIETQGDISREKDAEMSPVATVESVEAQQDAAKRHAVAANVTIGAALVSAGIGVVMLLLSD